MSRKFDRETFADSKLGKVRRAERRQAIARKEGALLDGLFVSTMLR